MRNVAFRGLPLVILAVALTGLTACASGGGGQAGDGPPQARRTGLLIEPDPAREIGYSIAWAQNLRVPSSERLLYAKVLGDVLVTVEQPSNLVSAVSLRNGQILWRRIVGVATDRLHAPARHGDVILVNSDVQLHRLRARDGEILGVDALDQSVASGPHVVENFAIFSGNDGTLFAHEIQSAYPFWRYKLTAPLAAPMITVGNNVFAADSNGVYAFLIASDGTLVWRGRTFGPVTTPPAQDDANVYVASTDRTLYALNKSSGGDQWAFRSTVPLTLPPAAYGPVVLLPVPGQGLLALDAIDGEERWRNEEPMIPVTRWREDNALVADQDTLRVLRLEDGSTTAEAQTLRLKDVLEGPDGSVVLVSPAGRLLRLNPTR